MKRTLLVFLLCATALRADTVYLKDGRKLEGTITDKGDTLTVKTKFGSIHVKKEDIDRIETSPTEEFARRAAAVKADDAEGHFALGQWCADNGMAAESVREFRLAVAADPGHAGAHKALGNIQAGERWGSARDLLASVDALLALGNTARARAFLEPVLAALEGGKDAETLSRAWSCRMRADLLDQRFGPAADAADKAAACATATQRLRASAIAEIVRKSRDGRYEVTASDLSVAFGQDLDDIRKPLTPGRQLLSDDRVLTFALRNVARADIEKGNASLLEGDRLAQASRKGAIRCYVAAEGHFDHADDLLPGFGKPYRIETVRRRVPLLLAEADEAMLGALKASPLEKKYMMTKNSGGRTVFTPEGLAEFQNDKRDFNTWLGKFDETYKEIVRLQERFPEEFEVQAEILEGFRKFVMKLVPEIRAFLNEAESMRK